MQPGSFDQKSGAKCEETEHPHGPGRIGDWAAGEFGIGGTGGSNNNAAIETISNGNISVSGGLEWLREKGVK